jgi:GT2 family glycosyltransferase
MESHPDCGILGVRLVGREGDLQPSCRYFPTPLNVFLSRTGLGRFFPVVKMVDDMEWDHASVRECDWVPGCYYLIRREVIEQVGLFDPRYFLYYEEVDHCKRAKQAGWKVVYYPHTTVVHIGGESAKSVDELNAASRQVPRLQIESELLHHGLLGLAWHMFLVTVGDFILALKALLKGRGRAAIKACWEHARVTWALLRETRLASQPTR